MDSSFMSAKKETLIARTRMNISDDIREPPDHLSFELELLYFLLTRSKPVNSQMPEEAAFASQLLPWVKSFNERLVNETRCRFFPLITAVLVSVLQWVCKMASIKIVPIHKWPFFR